MQPQQVSPFASLRRSAERVLGFFGTGPLVVPPYTPRVSGLSSPKAQGLASRSKLGSWRLGRLKPVRFMPPPVDNYRSSESPCLVPISELH
jgi:hypothetical protein